MTTATEKDLLISNSQSERRWTFALSASLERAKREDGVNLPKGIAFYVTSKAEIYVQRLLKAVVAPAGGQLSCLSKLCRSSISHPHTDPDIEADSSNTQC